MNMRKKKTNRKTERRYHQSSVSRWIKRVKRDVCGSELDSSLWLLRHVCLFCLSLGDRSCEVCVNSDSSMFMYVCKEKKRKSVLILF